jgi:hypothetical protein
MEIINKRGEINLSKWVEKAKDSRGLIKWGCKCALFSNLIPKAYLLLLLSNSCGAWSTLLSLANSVIREKDGLHQSKACLPKLHTPATSDKTLIFMNESPRKRRDLTPIYWCKG